MNKNMKHVKVTIMALILVLILSAGAAAAGPEVYLDGQRLYFDVDPIIENNSTLVPLRGIFEAMGAEVSWDQESLTAKAVNNDTTVLLTVGSMSATVNGQVQSLAIPAKIVNQRILAPLRFVGEAFGGEVSWDQAAYRIDIACPTIKALISSDQPILQISGEKINSAMTLSLSELKAMQDIIVNATYYSRGKAKENWAAASHNDFTGISLAALLEKKAGLKGVPSKVKIKAEDGYTVILSWDEVTASYIDETNPEQSLPIILAWSQDGKAIEGADTNSLRLVIGQKYQGDFNRQRWVRDVQSIVVD
jgi:hypothetical protein